MRLTYLLGCMYRVGKGEVKEKSTGVARRFFQSLIIAFVQQSFSCKYSVFIFSFSPQCLRWYLAICRRRALCHVVVLGQGASLSARQPLDPLCFDWPGVYGGSSDLWKCVLSLIAEVWDSGHFFFLSRNPHMVQHIQTPCLCPSSSSRS